MSGWDIVKTVAVPDGQIGLEKKFIWNNCESFFPSEKQGFQRWCWRSWLAEDQ